MKIGFDLSQTCNLKTGCGWTADLLIRALVDLAPDAYFHLYHQFGTWLNDDVSAGTHLKRTNVTEPFSSMSAVEAREIWKQVQKLGTSLPGDPDLVHSNNFQAPRTGRAKLVYTVHDVSFWLNPQYATETTRVFCRDGISAAVTRASGFLFFSQSSKEEFERIFPWVCNQKGIETSVSHLASRFPNAKEPRRPTSNSIWLVVGTVEPRKNYEQLLDAFDLYWRRSLKKRRLVIVGRKGWQSQQVHARIQSMEKRGLVIYRGYVEDRELLYLFQNAFALIFTSHYEGFGLPIVEAMSQACPVITRKSTSLPEVGGDAAIYYQDQTDDLIDRMLLLEEDSQAYFKASQCALRQAGQFSWLNTARKVLELYNKVVN
jgi:glycosyltransferase involved in cell wall biosynthesis